MSLNRIKSRWKMYTLFFRTTILLTERQQLQVLRHSCLTIQMKTTESQDYNQQKLNEH